MLKPPAAEGGRSVVPCDPEGGLGLVSGGWGGLEGGTGLMDGGWGGAGGGTGLIDVGWGVVDCWGAWGANWFPVKQLPGEASVWAP